MRQSVNIVRDLTVGRNGVPYQSRRTLFILRAPSIRRADVPDELAIQSSFVTKPGELRADFSDKTRTFAIREVANGVTTLESALSLSRCSRQYCGRRV